jgi:hypothetical protein
MLTSFGNWFNGSRGTPPLCPRWLRRRHRWTVDACASSCSTDGPPSSCPLLHEREREREEEEEEEEEKVEQGEARRPGARTVPDCSTAAAAPLREELD